MRQGRSSRRADCQRCDARRPTDSMVWARRVLFGMAFAMTAAWAAYALVFEPGWSTEPLTRRSQGPPYVFYLPAGLFAAVAAFLPRPRSWVCSACGHENRRRR